MITLKEIFEILEKYKNHFKVYKYPERVEVWPQNIKTDYSLFHYSSISTYKISVWSYTCFASIYYSRNDVFKVNLYNSIKIETKNELISIIEKFIIFEKYYLSSAKQFKSELLKKNITKDFE